MTSIDVSPKNCYKYFYIRYFRYIYHDIHIFLPPYWPLKFRSIHFLPSKSNLHELLTICIKKIYSNPVCCAPPLFVIDFLVIFPSIHNQAILCLKMTIGKAWCADSKIYTLRGIPILTLINSTMSFGRWILAIFFQPSSPVTVPEIKVNCSYTIESLQSLPYWPY